MTVKNNLVCIYTYKGDSVNIPKSVARVINDLDLKESSFKSARGNILDYVRYCNEEKGGFPTEGEPQAHARLINSYMTNLKKEGYARNTISGRWNWVSTLYKQLSMPLLNDYAFLEENPIELLEDRTGKTRTDYLPPESEQSQNKRAYYVDKEDLELLCDNLPSPAFRNEVMIRLTYTTGLRSSELANLKLENVNLEENLLEDFWVPKTAESRSLWIPDTTVWYLDQFINGGYRMSFSMAEESEYLFPNNRQEKIHSQRLTKVLKKAASNAGIQESLGEDKSGNTRAKVTAHALRRGHGMHLYNQGKSLPEIQFRLGHSSPDQTSEYLPITVEESKQQLTDVTF
ncbi:hypothetical protein DJ69_16930 [Halorubrum persicum]|uniref:Tyr recombinase domain-containing protein n=1 Tax=Halorubrum persicum TaxID=1383844 RepID=A0A2G1WER5_9EURY|nr:site-specific integrase [Halorubrum persicum]PHQ37478.1 hypothetical protein DJ69_16930 [Halorubrum persicum]